MDPSLNSLPDAAVKTLLAGDYDCNISYTLSAYTVLVPLMTSLYKSLSQAQVIPQQTTQDVEEIITSAETLHLTYPREQFKIRLVQSVIGSGHIPCLPSAAHTFSINQPPGQDAVLQYITTGEPDILPSITEIDPATVTGSTAVLQIFQLASAAVIQRSALPPGQAQRGQALLNALTNNKLLVQATACTDKLINRPGQSQALDFTSFVPNTDYPSFALLFRALEVVKDHLSQDETYGLSTTHQENLATGKAILHNPALQTWVDYCHEHMCPNSQATHILDKITAIRDALEDPMRKSLFLGMELPDEREFLEQTAPLTITALGPSAYHQLNGTQNIATIQAVKDYLEQNNFLRLTDSNDRVFPLALFLNHVRDTNNFFSLADL